MKSIFACITTLLVLSCSQSEADIPLAETISKTTSILPTHNATSKFSIEGMTCEIGCVRTVKSHLSKMEGVIEILMDFDTARTEDYSTVKFDNRIVSESDMAAEIESIANGIYAVTKTAEQKL